MTKAVSTNADSKFSSDLLEKLRKGGESSGSAVLIQHKCMTPETSITRNFRNGLKKIVTPTLLTPTVNSAQQRIICGLFNHNDVANLAAFNLHETPM